jgi:hypothetical protein
VTSSLNGDYQGKIAALEPSFRLLAGRTRVDATADMMGLYAEHFVQQNLMIEAVNQTVRDIVVGWDKPYWPSAEYIAVKARQKQRSVMDEMHGVHTGNQALEDWCEAEAQRRWDERLAEANAWRERDNMEPFKRFVREIDQDIARMIQTGLYPFLTESKPYRGAFREGRAVGRCLVEIGKEMRILAKQQEIARKTAVQQALREDATEMAA